MKRVLSSKESKQVDLYTINTLGIPALVLMERAGMSVCDEIENRIEANSNILVICGNGNNGGDGLVIARILSSKGYKVDIYLCEKENGSEGYIYQLDKIKYYNVDIVEKIDRYKYACIVDAIFGIGLSRQIEGKYFEIIELVNDIKAVKFAVDCPSGVDTTTGEIMGIAVNSEYTVTFGNMKVGLLLYPGTEYCGEIIVSDIGFPEEAYKNVSKKYMSDESVLDYVPYREKYSNKGTFGKVLIIAGSKNMCGAAVMATKACYATGAGLVKVMTDEKNREIMQVSVPEAIFSSYNDKTKDEIVNEIKWADVVLIGPGLGVNTFSRELVRIALSIDKPLVVDADAINILAIESDVLNKINNRNVVITPHLGEMSRLIGKSIEDVSSDIINVCQMFAKKYGVICVLKDARTIIGTSECTVINTTGNCGMAKGGSGDVLAGMITGFIAQKNNICESAILGVYLHGLSGDDAATKKGKYSMSPFDIINNISEFIG